jgi:hypothetical protein
MPVFRILLDNNVPLGLIPLLRPHEAFHTSRLGWAELQNGDLLRMADQHGYHILVTGDKNLRYQQNLTRVGCSIVELSVARWPTVRTHAAMLRAAIETIQPGSYLTVTFPRPPLRRRPSPRPEC